MTQRSPHSHRWTETELRELIAAWLRQETLTCIAAKFGVTRHAITKQVTRMRNEGVPLPRRTPGNSAGRNYQLWTQEEIEYLVRRRREFVNVENIAVELNRTILAVQGMIQKLRKEGIDLTKYQRGRQRLWSADSLRNAIVGRHLELVHDDVPDARFPIGETLTFSAPQSPMAGCIGSALLQTFKAA